MEGILSYQDILASAYRNLGNVNADADLSDSENRQGFNSILDKNRIAQKKNMTRSLENNSSRGLLNSTIALDDQADIATGYSESNANTMNSLTSVLANNARKRLEAQNQYADSQNAFERYRLANIIPPAV